MIPSVGRLIAVTAIIVLWSVGARAEAAARPRPDMSSIETHPVALSLDKAGVYRVTGSWLASRGISWDGMAAGDLAVTFDGRPMDRLVSATGRLSSSSYVEFYAAPFSSMYTATAVYELSDDHSLARPLPVDRPSGGHASTVSSYAATYATTLKKHCATQNGGCLYEPMAPGNKWFFNELIAEGSPVGLTTHFPLHELISSAHASLFLDVWGVTDFSGPFPQHDIQAFVNGHKVLEIKFSGGVEQTATAAFPEAWLHSGKNKVKLLLPGTVKNSNSDLDILDIRDFVLSYSRRLVADNGSLTAGLPARARAIISGFSNDAISVWEIGGRVAKEGDVVIARSGKTYDASFVTPEAGTYIAVDRASLLKPSSAATIPSANYLTAGRAKLLIVAPREFWTALQPLVAFHDAHGLPTKLADIHDVFDRYSHGLFDASAIRAYVSDAIRKLGIEALLLVGADTYDYHQYIDCANHACPGNSKDVSLVPSLYTDDTYYGQIPSDELLVDQSGTPRVAVGRIPAVTVSQVRTAVKRTLSLVEHPPSHKSAVMVGGTDLPTGDTEFEATNDELASELPTAYSVAKLDQPPLTHKQTRQDLLKMVRDGVTIADFVGHGNLEQWDQDPVLTVQDVSRLKPRRAGQLYFGWGCQTAYDVDPTDRALNARLLFSGGASLTLGSTGLDLAQPQAEIAQDFFHELFSDSSITTIGGALVQAERTAYAEDPTTEDPIRSYEIFGDPTIPLTALR